MNENKKISELVDNLIQIFATEPPEFAINVLSAALGIVVAHCAPESEEAIQHQFDANVAHTVKLVREANANEKN